MPLQRTSSIRDGKTKAAKGFMQEYKPFVVNEGGSKSFFGSMNPVPTAIQPEVAVVPIVIAITWNKFFRLFGMVVKESKARCFTVVSIFSNNIIVDTPPSSFKRDVC